MESAERVDGFLMAPCAAFAAYVTEGSPRLRHFAEIAAASQWRFARGLEAAERR
jgi:hypothetical protein